MDTEMAHGDCLGEIVNGRSYKVSMLSPHSIVGIQEELRPLFKGQEEALRRIGGFNNVVDLCSKGTWQLFALIEATPDGEELLAGMVTEISERPEGRVLTVIWLGGREIKTILKFWHRFDAWARGLGCVYIEVWARKGLTKILPEIGFETEQYIMRKRFANEGVAK